ncbi:hypothetical protein [Streptomyces sp. NPDC018031]|uniref:hypothetical protein n=1 Tax=Streptomyces sp. NPDC018031 TaxID=3365033 RepID=UPI0037BAC8F4
MSVMSVVFSAVRLPRTAVGRRALMAGLFLGAFLVLGFVSGGSAQAAGRELPGTPEGGAVTTAAGALDPVTAGAARQRTETGAESSVDAVETTTEATTEAARTAGTTTRDTVRRPVEERVGDLTDPVDDLVRDTTGALPVPLPDVVPGAQDGTGAGDRESADRQRARVPSPESGGTAAGHRTTADHHAAATEQATPAPTATRDAEQRATAATSAADGGSADHGPVQGPFPGTPFGVVTHCTGDNGAPRGGDQHAALPPAGTACFGLVPGALGADDSAPTRERYREVLEFPG